MVDAVVLIHGVLSFPLILNFFRSQMIFNRVILQIDVVGSCRISVCVLFVRLSIVNVCVVFVQSRNGIGDKIAFFAIVLFRFVFFTFLRMAFGRMRHQITLVLGPVHAMRTLKHVIWSMFQQHMLLHAIRQFTHEVAFIAFNPFAAIMIKAVVLANAAFSFSLVVAFVAFVPLNVLLSHMMSYRVALHMARVISFVRTFVTFKSRAGRSRVPLFVLPAYVTSY
jgi:hypothetical protein